MRVHNTLGGRKEELIPLHPGKFNIYVCGPTTYNYIHLGNARPLVVFDTVRRYLEFRGYQVTYVQNFTDVDDKIINRGREEGQDPLRLAERYIEEYFKDADALGIKRADVHPRASQHIDDMIAVIAELIGRGFAYAVEGDVYYRVKAFEQYGKLSGRCLEDMLAGARINIDERKEDPMDFALWKKAKSGEPSWESPWGQGRPGWHIECSVMSTKYLGETIDIHGGGSDLIFPHHENEIAQAEAYTGQPFVRYWMHNGFITINNEKMSKSLGNFFILREVLDKYPADVVRYYLITTHYRSPLDFDDGKLEEARKALGRLKTTLMLAGEFITGEKNGPVELVGEAGNFISEVNTLQEKFIEAMDDDFNTAKAAGFLFDIAHVINSFMARVDKNQAVNQKAVGLARQTLTDLGDILGIFMAGPARNNQIADGLIQLILELRQKARQDKDYALADSLRNLLTRLGVKVEDSPEGSRFRYETAPGLDELVNYLINLRQEFKAEKKYRQADWLREQLKAGGIILEDTREGVRWKIEA